METKAYTSGKSNSNDDYSQMPATAFGSTIPPQSLESEKALLGAVMLRPDAMYEIIDLLRADCFYAEKHRIIFSTMLLMQQAATPIDLVSLSQRLKEQKELDKVGGSHYLTEIVESTPTSANVRHYAKTVQKKYLLRRLITASTEINKLSFDEAHEIDVVLDRAQKMIFEISTDSDTRSFADIKDVLGNVFEQIDRMSKSDGEVRGVASGFTALDKMLSGFQPSDLIILAARPSVGKTSLVLDFARQAAIQNNTPVGFFSLEMSADQLVNRLLSAEAGVDSWKMRTGNLSKEEDFKKLSVGMDTLSKAPIYIDDEPGANIMKMRSVCRRLKAEKGLGLVIVDYLQLMSPVESKGNDNLVQQTTEISRSLKSLARELDVPVIALSQLNRSVETRGGTPRLSDLRDSGSIEQDADVVMFIHREDRYREEEDKTGIAEILVEKHRNGATGKVELFFDEKKTTFRNLDNNQYGSGLDDF